MINRRVSVFHRYCLEATHHMVCQYTLDSAFVVCPGTGKITGWSTDNPDVGSARLWFPLGEEASHSIFLL